jgi:hypothetical protein
MDKGNKPFLSVQIDTSANALDGTYDQISAALPQEAAKVRFSASAAMGVILAVGASSSEVVQCCMAVPAQGSTETMIVITKGVRVAVKSLSGASISAGIYSLDFFH